ncbi:MAG: cobalamin biosynthesis protein CbiG [bacterium]|nr:cobalamin biosynthesis protein CbiG [bacterium]
MTGSPNQKVALLAITKHGCELVKKAATELTDATIAVPIKFAENFKPFKDRLHTYEGPSKAQIDHLFEQFDQIVFFVSLGAVVRLISPHLKSKEIDPGVVVVDDAAQYVIPVLSGHVGGANEFAEQLATILGARAVLTTASDARKTIAVDILGRDLDWKIEAPKWNLIRVSAHIVNDEPVALVQECGSKDWWKPKTPLPKNIHLFERFADVDLNAHKSILWITQKEVPQSMWDNLAERLIVYRPPEGQ